MTQQLSPQSSIEDLSQWEIVDVEAQSKQVSLPQRSHSDVPIEGSQLGKDEEKDNVLHKSQKQKSKSKATSLCDK